MQLGWVKMTQLWDFNNERLPPNFGWTQFELTKNVIAHEIPTYRAKISLDFASLETLDLTTSETTTG